MFIPCVYPMSHWVPSHFQADHTSFFPSLWLVPSPSRYPHASPAKTLPDRAFGLWNFGLPKTSGMRISSYFHELYEFLGSRIWLTLS